MVEHGEAISDPLSAAGKVNEFLGGGLDVAKMAAAVDPALHRNRVTAYHTGDVPGLPGHQKAE